MSKDSQQSEEVDLGQLFKLIGNMFDRLFRFIGSIFYKLFLVFVWMVFFVKKHFLKLVIAGVLGMLLGFGKGKVDKTVYKSSITIKQNYETGENLFNSLNYYNDLVSQNDIRTLSSVLSLDSLSAGSIISFEMASGISENDKLINYDNYLKQIDSVLGSKYNYETYLKNENDYNHSLQQITIKSTQRHNFKIVFDEIIDNINANEFFLREQQKDLKELDNKVLALKDALVRSDSLQSTYKRVLEMSKQDDKGSQTSVTIKNTDDKNRTKEFELYQSELEIQRELVELEREIEDKKFIIEVLSSKQDSGSVDNKKDIFGFRIGGKLYYGILLASVTFIVLLGLEFAKFLEKFKEKVV